MESHEKKIDTNNTGPGAYEEGSTHLFNIPPGWLLAGTVQAVTDMHIVLKDAVYLEGINDGHSAFSVATAVTPKDLNAVVSKSYPMRDGACVRRDAILISVPCARDMTPLSRSGDAAAIKKAAGK